MTILHYAERTSLTSADLRNFAFGELPWILGLSTRLDGREVGNIDDKFLRTEELMCAEALTTGKVKMHDGSFIQYEVDDEPCGHHPSHRLIGTPLAPTSSATSSLPLGAKASPTRAESSPT